MLSARIERELLSTWEDICAALDGLLVQEHDFRAATIDTADFLEKVYRFKLRRSTTPKPSPRSGMAKAMFSRQYVARITQKLDALRERRGMAIIIICMKQ